MLGPRDEIGPPPAGGDTPLPGRPPQPQWLPGPGSRAASHFSCTDTWSDLGQSPVGVVSGIYPWGPWDVQREIVPTDPVRLQLQQGSETWARRQQANIFDAPLKYCHGSFPKSLDILEGNISKQAGSSSFMSWTIPWS